MAALHQSFVSLTVTAKKKRIVKGKNIIYNVGRDRHRDPYHPVTPRTLQYWTPSWWPRDFSSYLIMKLLLFAYHVY